MSVLAVIACLLCGFALATTTALLTARDIRQHQLRTGILTRRSSWLSDRMGPDGWNT